MKHTLYLKEGIALSKSICYIDLSENEIEITKEQYNQMNEFPLKLTLKDGKVKAWEKTIIEQKALPAKEIMKELTVEERVSEIEKVLINKGYLIKAVD